jgi:RND family efflux transporter MFP subunit
MNVAKNLTDPEPIAEPILAPPFQRGGLAGEGDHGGAAHLDEIGAPPAPPRPNFFLLLVLLLLACGAVAGAFFYGWFPKARQEKALLTEAERIKNAVPRVSVVHARQSEAVRMLALPGDVQALEETTVYARTSGYLKRWLVDIGDEAKAGQPLALIDIPEIDDELHQANATLGQLKAKLLTAEANNNLAQTTLRRYETLAATNAISKQELDERRAAADTAESTVTAAKADVVGGEAAVQRLTTLQSFSHVYAPFKGTITARSIEVGQLVTAGNGATQALFHIANTNPVRVFVNVPQVYGPGVKTGLKAEIKVRELPAHKFIGTVTRTAGAIDPASRTLLTEIQVPNDDHALLIGSYVQVQMQIARENPPLLIPAAALVINADGTRVATVDSDHHVRFKPVEVAGDYGSDVGVSSGLSTADLIISNPGERISEGCVVQIDEPKSAGAEK